MRNPTTISETTTNTTPGSQRFADVDMRPICENMTNPEFRKMFSEVQARAAALLDTRAAALQAWSKSERDRVFKWFGRDDEPTRAILLNGLTKVASVVRTFNEHSVVRAGSAADLATGCTLNPVDTAQEAAHVCAPDTATHTIAISPKFCTMRPWSAYSDSRVSTVIHEATHFLDTMATTDEKYTITPMLSEWGRTHPSLAIKNADSVAGYVVDGD